MSSQSPVVPGTRRAYKELVDGTLRVQVDIDPEHKARFLELFKDIDMPLALAPLVPGFERSTDEPREGGWKIGPLAQSAVLLCRETDFQKFVVERRGHSSELPSENGAAAYVKDWCEVESRKDLDTVDGARERFGALMAEYRQWLKK